MFRQAAAELLEWLHIAVRRVNIRIAMIEVDVGRDEDAAVVQQLGYLGELLGLELADILEEALCDHDIEPLITEPDRLLEEIGLD